MSQAQFKPVIRRLYDGRSLVFVFGSNLAGRHGKGAALFAKNFHGAKPGQGIGLSGNSYALPTKDARLKVLSLSEIGSHLADFFVVAKMNPNLVFQLTRVGCGLAGFNDNQIIELIKGFSEIPSNVVLPGAWRKALNPSLAILSVMGEADHRDMDLVFSQIDKKIELLREQGVKTIVLCSNGGKGAPWIAEQYAVKSKTNMTVFERNEDLYAGQSFANAIRTCAWYSSDFLWIESEKSASFSQVSTIFSSESVAF